MDQRFVSLLEDELQQAIASAIDRLDEEELPMHPSDHVVHLMAKAAATVYETAVEVADPEE